MLQSIHAVRATLTNASVGTNHQHGKVWAVASETKDGCFQILVVASQVNESDHFGRTLTDLFCCPGVTVIYHLKGQGACERGSPSRQVKKTQLLSIHFDVRITK